MQFQRYLTEQAKLLARIEARSSDVTKQEIALKNKRLMFLKIPLWKRLWWAMTTTSL
jgi:hypothetical protein